MMRGGTLVVAASAVTLLVASTLLVLMVNRQATMRATGNARTRMLCFIIPGDSFKGSIAAETIPTGRSVK